MNFEHIIRQSDIRVHKHVHIKLYCMQFPANANAGQQSYIISASDLLPIPASTPMPCPPCLDYPCLALDILAQPPDALSVSLPHDHTAHEHLDGSDTLKRHLALACGLVQTKRRAKLVLRHGLGVVDLVAKNDKGGVLEFVHGEESVELGLGLVEALVVFCVNEEDDAGDFGD